MQVNSVQKHVGVAVLIGVENINGLLNKRANMAIDNDWSNEWRDHDQIINLNKKIKMLEEINSQLVKENKFQAEVICGMGEVVLENKKLKHQINELEDRLYQITGSYE